ncbi:MAG: hypothetical protein DRN95_05150 [Candidatus Hydrothermarchaeota archaeon]|nr:MAG: hypothetical protein DRN95_05150 [Candidatus Hydrothermarchaeota archaeon]
MKILPYVSIKNQIVIPKKIREIFDLKKGDELIFEIEDNRIVITIEKPFDPIEAIDGLLEGEDIKKLKNKTFKKLKNKKLGLE